LLINTNYFTTSCANEGHQYEPQTVELLVIDFVTFNDVTSAAEHIRTAASAFRHA